MDLSSCRQQSTELYYTLINSLGTSKYIQTIGKTYSAPQITLTQKAHYQHTPQLPILCTSYRTSPGQPSRTGNTIGFLLPPWTTCQPDFRQGSRQKPFPGRPLHYRLSPDGKVDTRLPATSRQEIQFSVIDFRSLPF